MKIYLRQVRCLRLLLERQYAAVKDCKKDTNIQHTNPWKINTDEKVVSTAKGNGNAKEERAANRIHLGTAAKHRSYDEGDCPESGYESMCEICILDANNINSDVYYPA